MSKLLENKTAIITGATRGIGRGIAQTFALNGCNVAFTYNSSIEAAQTLEKELNKTGIKAKSYRSNAADFDQAQVLIDKVLEDFGTVDVLINNAGITKDNLLMRMDEADFDQVVEVNLKSRTFKKMSIDILTIVTFFEARKCNELIIVIFVPLNDHFGKIISITPK